MKRSGDSTHHSRSPTPTLNGCELTPSTRAQSSDQEYSGLTASKRHPSTPYSRNTPKAFREKPGHTFPRTTKHVYTSLACSQDCSKISGEWKFGLQGYGCDENRTGYHSALIQLFSRHFGIHSSWEAKQRDAEVAGSFTPVSHFVYGDDQFATLSVPFQNAITI